MATGIRAAEDRDAHSDPRQAFVAALRGNQSMVFSIAYHFLRDRAAAEELAQDVFLQLFRKFDEMESDAHITFWLRRTTSNRCIDYVRKQKFRAAIALEHVPEPRTEDSEADPLLSRRLRALIASLPEKQRIVTVLRFQEELMPEEIAKILDMPVRSVKSYLQRSLAMLREKIGRSMGDIR
jgi:RNA polymerase sigma-70 factor (ECF subfamily)